MATAKPIWHSTVVKDDLLRAIGFVRTRSGLRYKGPKLEPDIDIMACKGGVSFRTSQLACDVTATGDWTSPIRANGPVLRRLAPKLSGPDVTLRYEDGKLFLNATQIPAREL